MGCLSSVRILVGDLPCNYSVAIRVNRVMLVSLCAETIYTFIRGTKCDSCGRKCISLSTKSCQPNNRCGECEIFMDVGGPRFDLEEEGVGVGDGRGKSICACKL